VTKAERARTPRPRPGPDELAAAAGRTIADVAAPDLRVLFCGINPSLYSAATGRHFARPGNRFWPALHLSGFTSRLLHPEEQDELPAVGLGITNVVARATARADELAASELAAGGRALEDRVARLRPQWLAVAGVTAYRVAFARPGASVGPQPDVVAGAPVWVLPNPSGLNAHWSLPALAAEFARLRLAVDVRTGELRRTAPPSGQSRRPLIFTARPAAQRWRVAAAPTTANSHRCGSAGRPRRETSDDALKLWKIG